jgi:hypothetical protein
MVIGAAQGKATWTGPAQAWVPIVAGLATVVITTLGAVLGPAGMLVGWLVSCVACGLVLTAARDPRATRVTVAMVALVPTTTLVGGILLLPLWAVVGPWVVGAVSISIAGLTPMAAMAMAGRRYEFRPSAAPTLWLWIRLGLAACTAAVVVTGHAVGQLLGKHGRLDDGFFALLLLSLLPVLIYAIGTRQPTTVVVCGSLVFVVTASGWALLLAENGNQFAGVWVMLGWMLALVVATAGTLRDN